MMVQRGLTAQQPTTQPQPQHLIMKAVLTMNQYQQSGVLLFGVQMNGIINQLEIIANGANQNGTPINGRRIYGK